MLPSQGYFLIYFSLNSLKPKFYICWLRLFMVFLKWGRDLNPSFLSDQTKSRALSLSETSALCPQVFTNVWLQMPLEPALAFWTCKSLHVSILPGRLGHLLLSCDNKVFNHLCCEPLPASLSEDNHALEWEHCLSPFPSHGSFMCLQMATPHP